MGRNKEYTSDAVKESVQAAMAKIKAYFDKKWAPGKEYDVIKHIQTLLNAEIDKYVAPGKAGDAYRHLASYTPGSKKYNAVYAKNLEQYGPYLMELFVEYADSLGCDVVNRIRMSGTASATRSSRSAKSISSYLYELTFCPRSVTSL